REAELPARAVRTGERRRHGRAEPARAAQVEVRVAGGAAHAVGADDEVREAVAVDVPRARDRVAELPVRAIGPREHRRGRRAEPADDEVREALAVAVPRARHRGADAPRVWSGERRRGRRARPTRAAQVDVSVLGAGGADDEVREAVAVDVPRARDGEAELFAR